MTQIERQAEYAFETKLGLAHQNNLDLLREVTDAGRPSLTELRGLIRNYEWLTKENGVDPEAIFVSWNLDVNGMDHMFVVKGDTAEESYVVFGEIKSTAAGKGSPFSTRSDHLGNLAPYQAYDLWRKWSVSGVKMLNQMVNHPSFTGDMVRHIYEDVLSRFARWVHIFEVDGIFVEIRDPSSFWRTPFALLMESEDGTLKRLIIIDAKEVQTLDRGEVPRRILAQMNLHGFEPDTALWSILPDKAFRLDSGLDRLYDPLRRQIYQFPVRGTSVDPTNELALAFRLQGFAIPFEIKIGNEFVRLRFSGLYSGDLTANQASKLRTKLSEVPDLKDSVMPVWRCDSSGCQTLTVIWKGPPTLSHTRYLSTHVVSPGNKAEAPFYSGLRDGDHDIFALGIQSGGQAKRWGFIAEKHVEIPGNKVEVTPVLVEMKFDTAVDRKDAFWRMERIVTGNDDPNLDYFGIEYSPRDGAAISETRTAIARAPVRSTASTRGLDEWGNQIPDNTSPVVSNVMSDKIRGIAGLQAYRITPAGIRDVQIPDRIGYGLSRWDSLMRDEVDPSTGVNYFGQTQAQLDEQITLVSSIRNPDADLWNITPETFEALPRVQQEELIAEYRASLSTRLVDDHVEQFMGKISDRSSLIGFLSRYPVDEQDFVSDMFGFFFSSFVGFGISASLDFIGLNPLLPSVPAKVSLLIGSLVGLVSATYFSDDLIDLTSFGLGFVFNIIGAILSAGGRPGLSISFGVNALLMIYSLVWMLMFLFRLDLG
ncbi:MAG: hypothetical protein IH840_00255 [Candidatus Heimdallarchaeota archaeon]|nr:hypothetical protein [Candidatus Heimdallarchaeota archaeon]